MIKTTGHDKIIDFKEKDSRIIDDIELWISDYHRNLNQLVISFDEDRLSFETAKALVKEI